MEKQGRFDFEIETVQSGSDDRTARILARPSPRRYVEIEIDGVRWYRDKYLNALISLEEMTRQMNGLPIYNLTPSIDSTANYADRRMASVENQLNGGEYVAPDEVATPHRDFRREMASNIVFLSVDICGSTAYRRKDARGFDRAYEVFIKELGTLVGHFHGAILKTTGDGFIAYIDHPSFTRQCDNAVDLGLSLISFSMRTLNPALKSAGLRPLSIRVGADYGLASTRIIEVPSTNYRNVEVSSDALNRAVKIEESCKPNQLRIGRELYELVHVQWLERAEEVPFDGDSVGIEGYKVYKVR
ncbi:adenylate/guanylate cyclase domain-containing protein [Burkholderia ambifaria]|uniref:adenylate/guanylate cyclase domain-containing protein n=1 Tax=Burkholderia ambifaria TaxID=152480 RepID=UPI00158A7F6A|nr:adenylate/guanylate cyclase domain-containing protein [Burkholderia ambifaria]